MIATDFTVLSLTVYRSYVVYWKSRHLERMPLWDVILKDGTRRAMHLTRCILTVVRRHNVLCYHVFIEPNECHILPCKNRC